MIPATTAEVIAALENVILETRQESQWAIRAAIELLTEAYIDEPTETDKDLRICPRCWCAHVHSGDTPAEWRELLTAEQIDEAFVYHERVEVCDPKHRTPDTWVPADPGNLTSTRRARLAEGYRYRASTRVAP